MSDEITDEVYYASMKELFKSPGWAILLDQLVADSTMLNSVEDTSSVDDLWYRKGQLAVISNLINLQATLLQTELEAAKDADDY
jgi:hypothetical protein